MAGFECSSISDPGTVLLGASLITMYGFFLKVRQGPSIQGGDTGSAPKSGDNDDRHRQAHSVFYHQPSIKFLIRLPTYVVSSDSHLLCE
jgi:hypothetical protein